MITEGTDTRAWDPVGGEPYGMPPSDPPPDPPSGRPSWLGPLLLTSAVLLIVVFFLFVLPLANAQPGGGCGGP